MLALGRFNEPFLIGARPASICRSNGLQFRHQSKDRNEQNHLWPDACATPSHGVFTLTDKLIGIDGHTAPSITSERPMN